MHFLNTLSRRAARAVCAAVLPICLFVPSTAVAQPPPQGPAAATINALSVPVDGLTGLLMAAINTKVAAENVTLASDPSHRAVITASYQQLSPFMMYTTDADKPNQFYAEVPYTISYQVTNIKAKVLGVWVSYPFDRTITQYIDMNSTCDGWYTGSGKMAYTAVASPAYLEGDHSFAEDVLGALLLNVIPNYVDQAIGASLKNFAGTSTTVHTGVGCRSLGVTTKAQGYPWDSINYDPPSPFHLPVFTPLQQITVRVTKVRRLELHAFGGAPVYFPVESPALEFFAGYSHTFIQLPPMTEGQVVVPTQANTVVTPVPGSSGLLVLIGDLTYENIQGDDTNFVTFGKNSNFGGGTHSFQINKHWIEPVMMPGTKPQPRSGPAYEITVEITAPPGQIATQGVTMNP